MRVCAERWEQRVSYSGKRKNKTRTISGLFNHSCHHSSTSKVHSEASCLIKIAAKVTFRSKRNNAAMGKISQSLLQMQGDHGNSTEASRERTPLIQTHLNPALRHSHPQGRTIYTITHSWHTSPTHPCSRPFQMSLWKEAVLPRPRQRRRAGAIGTLPPLFPKAAWQQGKTSGSVFLQNSYLSHTFLHGMFKRITENISGEFWDPGNFLDFSLDWR